MRIYLLRHGDATQDPSLHDSDRPLSSTGLLQADSVARFLVRTKSSINLIFCSPLKRAQQMAAPIKNAYPLAKLLFTEYLVPGNDPRQLLELINANAAESVLLVGHEPYLSELMSTLATGKNDAKIEFKKSSLALLEATPPLRMGHGRLKWLVTIGHMELVI